jgi:type II restriction enzyme
MPRTQKQDLGDFGERAVTRGECPKCKREKTLRRLPNNFKCADVICDFCGYLAQVKTAERVDPDVLPKRLPGAAWKPQRERMQAGIYFPLFIVVTTPTRRKTAIYYLPADLQDTYLFRKRKPLSATAKRAGWTGTELQLDKGHLPIRLR